MLVSVDVNVWTATKQDKQISNEVTLSKQADAGSGKFTKYLFANNPQHKRIVNQRQLIYKWLKANTYRWNDSQDLLPTVDLEKFKKEYIAHESEFYRLVNDFLLHYDGLVQDMAVKHGQMFDIRDYPTAVEVSSKFKIRLYVSEVPSHDFRCQVSEDIAADLKQQYQEQADDIVHRVIDEQTTRITDVMESISHCCGVIEVEDQHGNVSVKKRAIYDTTVNRAKALVNTCKGFRPVKSGESDKLGEAVESLERTLSGVSTELLRDSDAMRDKVKTEIDDILSKFN
jgi:hypothetical protein|tara:strand:+ start:183 stop:1037 length:855 start_codon:yes stop_codon:yes gene_type:complete